ncbi:MAG: acyl--CoA ligase [Acidobacteria bacterium]|nr:acyl--CoA ligase [Acidobacteriota bacterium]
MLWRMLKATAAAHASLVAFRDAREEVTFSRLVEDAASVARSLGARGVEPGDRVAVVLRNGVSLARALAGILARGAVAVPLSPILMGPEIARCLVASSPKAAIAESDLAPAATAALESVGIGVRRLLPPPGAAIGSMPGAADPPLVPGRPAFDLFSTGSTGYPKRVSRTHAMLAADAGAYQAVADLGPGDVIAGVAPLFHSYGLSCVFSSVLASGASAVLFPEFDGGDLLREITDRRCTIYPGSAFHFSLLAEMTPRPGTDLSSLRLCFSCGLGLPEAVERRFRARFGVPVHQMYGATECSSATMNLEGDHEALIESSGRALPGVSVRIVREDGSGAPEGESGEVAVFGPAVAARYEDLPALSSETFRGGWFHSGDLGSLDADGNLRITGRLKLMINAAGNKVDPLEVERVLGEHPAVSEAAVVGVSGPHAVELVKAVIVRRAPVDERALRDFCRERLAPYKVPRLFQFVDRLPRSPTGKLLRKDLLD